MLYCMCCIFYNIYIRDIRIYFKNFGIGNLYCRNIILYLLIVLLNIVYLREFGMCEWLFDMGGNFCLLTEFCNEFNFIFLF